MPPTIDLTQAVLDSLIEHVAVIAPDGRIEMVNRSWDHFAHANNGTPQATCIGANYLNVCRSASSAGDDANREDASAVLAGLQALTEGKRDTFEIEYPCHSPAEKRWFLLHASRLEGHPDRIVVCHINITQRRIAEMEAEEGHRLTGVLELAGAVCHEMNQPLMILLGYADMLYNKLAPTLGDDDENVKRLKSMTESARQLGSITRKLQSTTQYAVKDYPGGKKIFDLDGSDAGPASEPLPPSTSS